MMDPGNGEPFHEHEKRWMLSEALKVSHIPVDKLFNLLQEVGGSPDWDHMLLPRGRTLSQCKDAYNLLRFGPPRPRLSPIGHPFSATIQQQPPPFQPAQQKRKSDPAILGPAYMSGEPSAKRRQSGLESMGSVRNIQIQPKPPNNGDPPSSMLSMIAGPPAKRRGRPPKMEVERRNQDAIRRGEVFAVPGMSPAKEITMSPYTPIAPTPTSVLGPPTSQGNPEQNVPDDQAEDSSGKKKRPKAAAKAPRALPLKQPGESSFSVNPPVPRLREPQVLQQAFSIPPISELQAPPSGTIASLLSNPLPQPPPFPSPSTVEAATSAAAQPSTEAAS